MTTFKKNQHHIICKSRVKRSVARKPSNIVIVDFKAHENFHHLFSNMLPEECIEYLVNAFWGGNWTFVRNALDREWNRRLKNEKTGQQ